MGREAFSDSRTGRQSSAFRRCIDFQKQNHLMPVKLTIQNAKSVVLRTVSLADADRPVLSDVLAAHGMPLNTRCGKQGWCHGCLVELVRSGITGEETLQPVKSCEIKLEANDDLLVRVPDHARLEAEPQVGDSFEINMPVVLDPPWELFEKGRNLALAVDVGTTTVAVALVDLLRGEVLARAGDFNAQIRFGDNVITRIVAAGIPGAREQMQRAVLLETIAPLVAEVCREASRSIDQIAGCMVAGNTTMLHLLAGEDPEGLGVVPFTPKFIASRSLHTTELGLRGDCPVVLLPGFSAYVGADLSAGVYATGMFCDEKPSLLVDIGTNGEIVLYAGGRLFGCATAAGPAFEGAGLLAGTRAQTGAISHVTISRGEEFVFDFETIGGGKAEDAPGLCGTAYVDFLAQGRASGLLLANGRFDATTWSQLPKNKCTATPGGRTFKLAGDLCINEADVAALLQAKAAIGAGIETLLKAAGLAAKDVGRLYLAGGFGLFIDVDHAIAIGLLPGFTREQIKVVGNTSLGGAILAALDKNALVQMEKLRINAVILELNEQGGFENCYLDHLSLP
ncbi:MAG: ASKHA domain-containing protein [Nibricoccus sp.]